MISKSIPTAMRAIEHNAGALKRLPGRGLPGKRAKLMPPVTTGGGAGKRRLGGGLHSQGLFAKSAFGIEHYRSSDG